MKRFWIVFLILLLSVINLNVTGAVEEENVTVTLNGNRIIFDAVPRRENERILVPIRPVCEAMGADVYWDDIEETVFVVKNEKKLFFSIGAPSFASYICENFDEFKSYVETDGIEGLEDIVWLDAPPAVFEGRTMLPIRAVCEQLGASVEWNEDTETISISYPDDLVKQKNTDTDFFEKYIQYLIEQNKQQVCVYTHRGVISVMLKSEDDTKRFSDDLFWVLREDGDYAFKSENKIRCINSEENGNEVKIEVEYTDDIDVENVLTAFLNIDVTLTVRDAENNICFDMDDFENIGFYYDGPSVSLKNPQAEIPEEVYLWYNERCLGKCVIIRNELGTFIGSGFKSEKEDWEFLQDYFLVARSVNEKAVAMKIEKLDFQETEYARKDKDLIFATIDSRLPLARLLAEKTGRNLGLTYGKMEADFDRGSAEIMIVGSLYERYKNKADYMVLSVTDTSETKDEFYPTFYLVMHAKNAELFEEIRTIIEKLPNYNLETI